MLIELFKNKHRSTHKTTIYKKKNGRYGFYTNIIHGMYISFHFNLIFLFQLALKNIKCFIQGDPL